MAELAFLPDPLGQLWLPDWGPATGPGSLRLTGHAIRGGPGPGAGEPVVTLTMAGEERPALFDSTVAVDPLARHRIGAIFVYGTLMVGERLHDHMHAHGSPGAPVPATTMGKLVDYGVYPGLIPTPGGLGLVKGELFRPEDVSELLPALDEVEGFAGHGSPGSLFRRVLLEVEAAGTIQAAWGYRSLVLGGSEVPSGDWRAR